MNINNKFNVYHKYGANSHFNSFKKINIEIINYYELNILKQIIKYFIKKQSIKNIKKNIYGLYKLFFVEQNIIISIAPYDISILLLFFINKRSLIYFQNSWHDFQTNSPHKNYFINKILWNYIIKNRVKKIFCVTNYSRQSLLNNLGNVVPIKVLYHSIIVPPIFHRVSLNFKILYLGRIEDNKGVFNFIKIAECLKQHNDIKFDIYGNGKNRNIVNLRKKINNLSNVEYKGILSNDVKYDTIKEYTVMLNPVISTNTWHETFGLNIIESMYCGVIPLSTNHIGPNCILRNLEILLCDENKLIENMIMKILFFKDNFHFRDSIKNKCIESSKKYLIYD